MKNLLEHVDRTIDERKLFRRGESILVAVSGGVDSLALLHLLHSLASRHRWQLTVAHFNHRLRGRSSDADERLVCQTTSKLGLKCVCGSAHVRDRAKRDGVSIEMAARELRHGFLTQTAHALKIRSIALAHHADDQVELFFLRLLRGAGGEGLAGMGWRSASPVNRSIQLIRPLLDVRKTDLTDFARERRIRFREDASNASLDMQRNRIRHELLPLLRTRYQPALEKVVLRVMEIVGADAEVVADVTSARRKQVTTKWSTWPAAVQRRALQQQLLERGLAADYDVIESLRLKPGQIFNLAPRLFAQRDETGQLHFNSGAASSFDPSQRKVKLAARSGTVKFDGINITWRIIGAASGTGHLRRQRQREFFDVRKVGSAIVLRHWQPGDRFQPIGMNAQVKLQDWFTNQKIPRDVRHKLIVATALDGTIFWIEGQRIDERFKVTSETKSLLAWNWTQG